MKSNDSIPEDEMLLAEACAAAKAWHLGWCKETPFIGADGYGCTSDKAVACCALGALHFAGHVNADENLYFLRGPFADVVEGNDMDHQWCIDKKDRNASLGWAFRCFMTQDESDPATEALIRERSRK